MISRLFPYPKTIRTVRRKLKRFQDKLARKWFYKGDWRRYVEALRRDEARHALPRGRVYADITVISHSDAATGIQRVVRAVSFLMAERAAARGLDLHFVYTHRDRHYIAELSAQGYRRTDNQVQYQAGDIFFALDYALDAVWQMRHRLAEMRKAGVRFWYLVHDFLPLTDPQWFSEPTVIRFHNWLAIIAATADGVFCVSPTVEQQMHAILAERFGQSGKVASQVIPMGADIAASRPSTGIPEGLEALLAIMRQRPTILMVGTIEPRKGYADALDALDYLWARSVDVNFVVVGGTGWKMEAFDARLAAHPQRGDRLHHPGKISDEALARVYDACTGVLFPSHAEGFGLPLVEALNFGKPVLARNLPVFADRGEGVSFFDVHADTPTLAQAIEHWLQGATADQGKSAPMVAKPLASWQDTADAMLAELFHAE